MKKLFSVLLAAMLLIVLTATCIAETVAEPPAPMFTIDITQLVIAVMAVVFNLLLVWLVKSVIPPLKNWLTIHTTTETQQRAWTMIKWLVEAAEQTITGSGMGRKRLEWVQAQLKTRGIQVDLALIEAAVREMKDNAYKEIKHVIQPETDAVSLDVGK